MAFYSPKRTIAMQYFMIDGNMTYTRTGDGYYGKYKTTNTNASGDRWGMQSIRPLAGNDFSVYLRLNGLTTTASNLEAFFLIYIAKAIPTGMTISVMFEVGVKDGNYHIWSWSPNANSISHPKENPLILPSSTDLNIYFSSMHMNKFYINDVEFTGDTWEAPGNSFPQVVMENHYSNHAGNVEINISDLSYDTVAWDITQKSVRDDMRERSLISKTEITTVEKLDTNYTLTNGTGVDTGIWTISNLTTGVNRWGQITANAIGEHYTYFGKINSIITKDKTAETFGCFELADKTRALIIIKEQQDTYLINRYDVGYAQFFVTEIPKEKGIEIMYSTYNRNKIYLNNVGYDLPYLPVESYITASRAMIGFLQNSINKIKIDITAHCYFKRELNLLVEDNRRLIRDTVYRNQTNVRAEIGYGRIDDTDPRFNYSNNFLTSANSNCFNGSQKYTESLVGNATMSFKFKGTGFRIVGGHNTVRAGNSTVNIDNGAIIKKFMQNNTNLEQTISFSIDNLTDTEHTVLITSGTDGSAGVLTLDNIDVKGKILHPYLVERDNISDLEIGDVISCDYDNTNILVGNFGKGNQTLIPPNAATKDGSLYFIKAADGLLIADRSVREATSWNTFLPKGLVEGAPYQLDKSKWKSYSTTAEIVNTATYTATGNTLVTSKTTPADANWSEVGYKSGFFQDTTNRTTGYLRTYFIFKKPTLPSLSTIHLNISCGFLDKDFSIELRSDGVYIVDASGAEKIGNYEIARNVIIIETDLAKGVSNLSYNGIIYNNRLHGNFWSWNGDTVYWVGHPVGSEQISFVLPRFACFYTPIKADLKMLNEMIIGMPTGGISFLGKGNTILSTDLLPALGGYPHTNEWDRYIMNNTLDGKITPADEKIWNLDIKIHLMNSVPKSGLGRNFDTIMSSEAMCVGRNQNKDGVIDSKGFMFHGKDDNGSYMGFRPIIKYIDEKLPDYKKPKNLWY